MQEKFTFRPKSNFVWGGLALLLDGLYVTQALFYSVEGENIWFDLGIALVVAVLVFLLWLRPKLVLHAEHVTVVNPLSTKHIRFENIKDLDTKWALRILHTEGDTRVWAATASGKFRWIAGTNESRWARYVPHSADRVVEEGSASQSVNSDSGLAAHLIRQRMNH